MIATALAVWGTACTAPPAAAPVPVSKERQLCFGRLPAGWAGATATTPGSFGAHAVAGDMVFGQLTGTGIAALDFASGTSSIVARYEPGVSGLGAIAVEPPWVVWEQLNSTTNLSDWSVFAVNQDTGERIKLATSRLPDGGFAPGQQPLPVLRHGVAAWAQPVRGANGTVQAELTAYDLGTRRSRTLDLGRISSPVYAGPYLLWAKIDGNAEYSLHAVDAATLRPAELPEPLRRPESVAYLGGSPGYLAWSSHDATTVDIWHFGTGRRTTFTTDRGHPFQFLHLAGDFLSWYGGTTSSVLDLRSGAAFDVAGTVTGSADWIVTAAPLAAEPARPVTRLSRIAIRNVPPVTASC